MKKEIKENEVVTETRNVSSYEYSNPENIDWYEQILTFTISLDDQLKLKYNQFYIAIRKKVNIVSILFRTTGLLVELCPKIELLYDPEQRLEDISEIGHTGTGKCRMRIEKTEDLNYLFSLIQQAYDLSENK